MRIRDKIDKKKLSHYLFNDEEIICMTKKYFNYNYISKDKIKDIILKFQNKYDGYLETTDKLFIGKEVLQYGEDILDEIAAELDIKLLEEKSCQN